MPDYGEEVYWDKRYAHEEDHPFDWLFDYAELQPIIEFLLPNKDEEIFLVGCGNAPFSIDLGKVGKYTNIWNTDISSVVIEQMRKKCPTQKWDVVNVLDIPLKDKSISCIIDKSLVDTLLCSSSSNEKLHQMMSELHRIMKPGGRFISFSLHPFDEVVDKYELEEFSWKCSFHHIKSNRWDYGKNRKRSTSHTMIVCDIPYPDKSLREPVVTKLDFKDLVLTDEEAMKYKNMAQDALFLTAIKLASKISLAVVLYDALTKYASEKKELPTLKERKQLLRMQAIFERWKEKQLQLEVTNKKEAQVEDLDKEEKVLKRSWESS